VYFTYLLPGKDRNLNGVFLSLVAKISANCGEDYEAFQVARQHDWKWDGPEVVRTYPSDEVIQRIKLERLNKGETLGRWVPFSVQLVYRDAKGHVLRTETYSSNEFIPDFDAKHPAK
jgi:hypothetical protein